MSQCKGFLAYMHLHFLLLLFIRLPLVTTAHITKRALKTTPKTASYISTGLMDMSSSLHMFLAGSEPTRPIATFNFIPYVSTDEEIHC